MEDAVRCLMSAPPLESAPAPAVVRMAGSAVCQQFSCLLMKIDRSPHVVLEAKHHFIASAVQLVNSSHQSNRRNGLRVRANASPVSVTNSTTRTGRHHRRHPPVQRQAERVGGLLQLPPAARGPGRPDPVRTTTGKGESRSVTGVLRTYTFEKWSGRLDSNQRPLRPRWA